MDCLTTRVSNCRSFVLKSTRKACSCARTTSAFTKLRRWSTTSNRSFKREFQIILGLILQEKDFVLYQNQIKMPLRDHYPNKMFLSDFTMKESLVKVKGELGEQTVEMDKGSKVWVVVRSVQNLSTNLGYKLTEGDIIKIGRVKLKVKQILIRNEEKTKMEESVRSECSQNKSENQINCRICFSSSNSQGNPLINPCKCSGSVQFIHLQCLKTWLKVKIYGN